MDPYARAQKAQADAALPDRSAWVEAHAGSGKTKVLIDRVARLLLRREDGRQGAAPDTILCITYTKAAANEMLSRLFKTLGDWSVAGDDTLRGELARLENRDKSAYDESALDDARTLFARALETPGGLRIETIHAFCSRILRRFPLEARVSPGFGEIEDQEADRLWDEAMRGEILEAAETDPAALSTLSETGGGLGASAVLSSLRGARAKLTGADRLAVKARIKAALNAPDETAGELVSQAVDHAFPRAEIQSVIDLLNSNPGAKKSDLALLNTLIHCLSDAPSDDRFERYCSVFLTAKGEWRQGNPYTAGMSKQSNLLQALFQMKDGDGSEVARIRQLLGDLKARLAYERTAALVDVGLPVLSAYASGKAAHAALDFDDLIQRTRALLTAPGIAEWVLFKLDGGLTHILLDEAQDTSPDQWTIINTLVEEFRAGRGADRAIDPRTQFTVGDKKQSIYSFQGADPEQFLMEKQAFIGAEEALHGRANLPDMTMSFRSTPQVLGFVDAVFNSDSFAGDPFSQMPPDEADELRHVARRADQPGRVDLWPVEPHDSAEETDPWDAPLDHIGESSPKNRLAMKIAAAIRAMIETGEPVWHRGEQRPVRAEDILILVRKRGALFEALIRALKDKGLPVAGADRLVLLDHIGVQDCLNLIRFALFPSDDLTLAEILRGPFCGLIDDNTQLYRLAFKRGGQSLWQRLSQADDPVFAPARAFCEDLLQHRHLPAFDFLMRALTTRRENNLSGWDHLIRRLGEPARDPVNALLNHALGHDMGEAASLQGFLAEIESDTSQLKRDLAEANGEIRVMTVHGAKGLQAPIVILPDTTGGEKANTDGLFMLDGDTPVYSPRKSDDPPEIERLRLARETASARESRRLLYVALTRAQDRLIVAGAHFGSKTGDGYKPASWYALCRQAMMGLVDANEETADSETLTYGDSLPPVSGHTAQTRPEASAPAWATRPARTEAAAARVRSPSRLLTDTAPVSRPFGAARTAALARGRLIHTLLQYLPELPETARKAAARNYLARHGELQPEALEEILDVTLRTLGNPDFADVFAPGGRSEAAIVGEIDTASGPLIINGRADRLVITDTDILVIDYKTDRPAPESADAIDASYGMQMAAYQAILKTSWPDRRVRAAILYTDGPHLFELPETLLQNSRKRLADSV
jgi:ATP-dependent helicase/nuclease subunit A